MARTRNARLDGAHPDARLGGAHPDTARRRGEPGAGADGRPYQRHIDRERAALAVEPADGWREALAWHGTALTDVLYSPPDATCAPLRVEFGTRRHARLTALAGAHGARRHATLLATFAATLASYAAPAGLDVPAIAVPMGTRTAESTGTVGPFVNEAALQLTPAPGDTFGTFLDAVRHRIRGAVALRGFPVAELRRRSGMPPWRPSVVFGYRTTVAPQQFSTPYGAIGYQAVVPLPPAGPELELQLLDRGAELDGWVSYDPARLSAESVSAMLDHWYRAIDLIAEAPGRPLRSLSLLGGPERAQLTALGTGPEVNFAGADTVHGLFEQQASRTPERVAVRADGREVSYAELDRQADAIAGSLRRAGVRAEQPVLVCVPRSAQLVAALLGVLKAGGCYIPLDPDDPAARRDFMAADSDAQFLLARPGDRPAGFTGTVVGVDGDCSDATPPRAAVAAGQLAYALYTSGSTGTPKAAMVSHAALRNRLLWMQQAYRLTAGDRVLHKTAIGFDVSGWEIFWPLVTGATLVVAPPAAHRDSAQLVRLLRDGAVTVTHFVPPALRALLDEPDVSSCTALRLVVCSGETLPPDLVERFHTRLDCRLENLYGPTEAAIDVTAAACPRGSDPVPIGRPIANADVRVLGRDLQPVPVGVTGEIHLGGVPLARGYLNRPGLTAERFVADPTGTGGRLYRTGDLGRYRRDGTLEYRGRIDHQVKIRGRRIEPAEIETVLHTHPGIRRAAVVAAPTERDEQQLVGYLVAAPDGRPDPDELDRWLRTRLPEAMVPAALVWLDELPRTPSGKLDRHALPAPGHGADAGYVAPRTVVEDAVASTWAELFGLERVGAHDDFFDLGGHSLLATRTLSRLRERFGVELPMRLVFERPTVAALAAAVDEVRTR